MNNNRESLLDQVSTRNTMNKKIKQLIKFIVEIDLKQNPISENNAVTDIWNEANILFPDEMYEALNASEKLK